MSDMDLIPQDYRHWLTKRAMLRNYGLVLVALLILTVAAYFAISHAAQNTNAELSKLKFASANFQRQRIQLDETNKMYAEYSSQWSMLRGLRAGAAVEDIFRIVDQSLPADDIWFVGWQFRRAGVVVDGVSRGVETGYFIITENNSGGTQEENWQVETHMTIRGQARDHQALSSFVRSLFSQVDVKDVNVSKTSTVNYEEGQVVEFNIAVILNSELQES